MVSFHMISWKDEEQCFLNLNGFRINRCLKPLDFGKVARVELHHFAVAFEKHDHETTSYLLCVNRHGRIHCSFFLFSWKLGVKPPRSGMTVPKLE